MIYNSWTIADLKKFSVYLKTFMGVDYHTPITPKMKKKDWVEFTTQMSQSRDFSDERILTIMRNVRWLVNHGIQIRVGMNANTNNFARKIALKFNLELNHENLTLQDYVSHSIELFSLEDFHLPSILLEWLITRNPIITGIRNSMPPVFVSQHDQREVQIDLTDEAAQPESELECKICYINKVCVVLSTCGHIFCSSCTKNFSNVCAKCRKPFKDCNKIRTFF